MNSTLFETNALFLKIINLIDWVLKHFHVHCLCCWNYTLNILFLFLYKCELLQNIVHLLNLFAELIDLGILNFDDTHKFSSVCFLCVKWIEKREDWDLLSHCSNDILYSSCCSLLINLINCLLVLNMSIQDTFWSESVIKKQLCFRLLQVLTCLSNQFLNCFCMLLGFLIWAVSYIEINFISSFFFQWVFQFILKVNLF